MIYRPEHPNPQFERENWQNLNGEWEFLFDHSVSGKERGLFKNDAVFDKKINVPFCVESKLSGIGYTDFINSVWYRRKINITEKELKGRVFLNIGACDYETTVYVNESEVGIHKGGYSSFKFEITDYLKKGVNTVIINAFDDTRSRMIPSGKQSPKHQSYDCFYTRTTGIWQTVWLEFTPKEYIKKVKYITDTENAVLTVTADLIGKGEFTAEAFFDGKAVGKASLKFNGGNAVLSIPLSEKHLWEIGNGRLYDLKLSYGEDTVKSYFGLRNISVSDNKVLLNGKSIFQRLVLDQGFYPDGIYTAPTEEALIKDIELSISCGFNGARLHQKVFEPRFLYHADRLGYIVHGEFASWGLNHTYADSIYGFIPEWLEVMERDYNHPSIITWCPFNETWDTDGRKQYDDLLKNAYLITKSTDSTRPCIDTSGHYHIMTDIYSLHDYTQNPEEFASHYNPLINGNDCSDHTSAWKDRQQYDGKMPFAVNEFGGTCWNNSDGWGYGDAPKSEQEFFDRFKGKIDALLDNPKICSLCYTQLTDVEQEQNGLFFYDRTPKFDTEVLRKVLSRKAAIEE